MALTIRVLLHDDDARRAKQFAIPNVATALFLVHGPGLVFVALDHVHRFMHRRTAAPRSRTELHCSIGAHRVAGRGVLPYLGVTVPAFAIIVTCYSSPPRCRRSSGNAGASRPRSGANARRPAKTLRSRPWQPRCSQARGAAASPTHCAFEPEPRAD